MSHKPSEEERNVWENLDESVRLEYLCTQADYWCNEDFMAQLWEERKEKEEQKGWLARFFGL